MKTFRKFMVPASGRSASHSADRRTLTVPDVVPSLKEIILSGSAQQVGALLYDSDETEGVRRLFAQGAPLEMILSAQLDGFPAETDDAKEPSDAKEEGEPPKSDE